MEAGTCPLIDVHAARTEVQKPKSILPGGCTQTTKIQHPLLPHFLWSELLHVRALWRPDEHSCGHGSWDRSLHWDIAMFVAAFVPTCQLPPGHCSPACGAQGTAFHQGILLQGYVQPGPYSTAVTVRHPFLIPQSANCLLEAQKYTLQ